MVSALSNVLLLLLELGVLCLSVHLLCLGALHDTVGGQSASQRRWLSCHIIIWHELLVPRLLHLLHRGSLRHLFHRVHCSREFLSGLCCLFLHSTVQLVIEGLVLSSTVGGCIVHLIYLVHLVVLIGLTLLLSCIFHGDGLLNLLVKRLAICFAALRGVSSGHVSMIPHRRRCEVAHQHSLLLLLRQELAMYVEVVEAARR